LASVAAPHDEVATDGDSSSARPTLSLGLVAAPGLASTLTTVIAEQVRADLEAAFPSVSWTPEVLTDHALVIPPAGVAELVDAVREELLDHDWAICVCVTDLPLQLDGRPIVSHVSLTHGVGIVSLPALGAVQLPRRLREHIVETVSRLVCDEPERVLTGVSNGAVAGCEPRVERVLAELARQGGSSRALTPWFVWRIAAGHLRLLIGMLRANRPWRLAARLHRSLFAAFAVSAYGLVTPDVWRIADSLDPLRLAALSVAAAVGTVVSLIVGHGLWERSPSSESRPQVVLFNLATALTVAGGVLALYIAQFVVLLGAALLLLTPRVLGHALYHHAQVTDYLKIVWLAASLATTGGALGAALESDGAVREAAYAYRAARVGTRSDAPGVQAGATDVSPTNATSGPIRAGARRPDSPS
jgi:hypothetical protein